jgi:hypothetical protein
MIANVLHVGLFIGGALIFASLAISILNAGTHGSGEGQ